MRHTRGLSIIGVGTAAALLAGCATTVSGQAVPGVTVDLSTSATTSAPTTSGSVSASSSTPTTSRLVVSLPTSSGSGSPVRPVPPSTTTPTTPSTTTPTTTTTTSSDTGGGTVAGISVNDVLDDLSDNSVASVHSSAAQTDLAAIAASAQGKGLDLLVVSIGDKIDDGDAGTLADKIFAVTGGTLVVLTPSLVTSRSDQLTKDLRSAANKAAAAGGSDDVAAVQAYVDSALSGVTPTTKKTTTKTTPNKVVNGIDVTSVAQAMGTSHVFVASAATGVDKASLIALATEARNKGLKISIMVLAKDVEGHLYDVADGVRSITADTVIAMSPGVYAISSGSATNQQLQDAIDAASDATTYVDVATAMVNSLLG